MSGALGGRCWYVDRGPGEEPGPHFPTEAAARADEAAAAVVGERVPRPVLRTRVGCWVAGCGRCGCPLGDEDTGWEQVHCRSRAELLGCLDAAGWRVVAGGAVCCSGCGAARPAVADVEHVAVTVCGAGAPRPTMGEVTACPELVVTFLRGERDGRWLGVVLTHRPTGGYLPLESWTADVGVLHRVAELVAHLDWSSTDPAAYAVGYVGPVIDAADRAVTEHARRPASGPGSVPAAGGPDREGL